MRRFAQIAALICTLIVGAAALAVIVSQTAWFKDWVRGYIVRQADDYVNGQLTIDRLDGNLFFGLELQNIRLTVNGQPVISVKDIGLDYSVVNFLSGGVVLDDIRLNQPVVRMEKSEQGWNLGQILKERRREADREGPGLPVSIGEIGITDGTVEVAGPVGTTAVDVPERFDRMNASIGFQYEPVHYTVDVGHISFRASRPGFALNELSGRLAVRDDTVFFEKVALRTEESSISIDGTIQNYTRTPVLNVSASSDKLALDEFARLLPALRGMAVQPAFELKARGPLNRLQVSLDSRSSAGNVSGDFTTDLTVPERTFVGEASVRHLDLAPFLKKRVPPSDITARTRFDLRMVEGDGRGPLSGVSGTWQVAADRVAAFGYDARQVDAKGRFTNGILHLNGRAAAYGGRATVQGTINPAEPLALDLRGDAKHLDLRNLPKQLNVPGVAGDLNLAYHVRGTLGRPRDLVAEATFQPSTFAGATIENASTGRVTLEGNRISYAANTTVRNLDLQRIGQGFGIDAIATDTYRTTLNGAFIVEGSGTTLSTLNLTARGTLTDSSVFGGQVPGLTFESSIADAEARVRAAGQFAEFDPAVVAGRSDLSGRIAGSLDVDATVRDLGGVFTPDSVSANGRVQLSESSVGGLGITQAIVDGTYDHRAGELRLLQINGPDLSLEAKGPITLAPDGGASNVEYKADLKRLETLAAFAKVPLSGSLQLQGRITGNGSALSTNGALSASNIKYGETSVLSAKSDYAVRLPDLSPARAEVGVNATATLLTIGGRELTEASVNANWTAQTVAFDARVADQRRVVGASGEVTMHPDHQELHLHDLAISTQGVEWRTPAGVESAIRYGSNRIEVDRLQFVNGSQQIAAHGAFGSAGDRLKVELRSVDLAAIDQLALGTQRFGGALNASAVIGGTREAPDVAGEFNVVNGSFRDFKYQTLSGNAQYRAEGLRLDARLSQTPDAWIAAKGFVPSAFFGGPAQGDAAHAAPVAGQELDVHVTSSALDLGILQGFVPQLSRVSGTLQADVRAIGSPQDPHVTGSIDVRNGAFSVADLTKGVYTGLDTRIALETDRVVIERFRVLDEHKNWLEVDGQIAVHERQVGGFQVAIKSHEFEVIDNQLADVKLDTDVRLSGELLKPRVEGELAVHTGTVYIDKILEQFTSDAYALEATKLESQPQAAVTPSGGATAAAASGQSPAGAAETPAPAAGTPFDALAMDVVVNVPNNLVVKGAGLNPSGASPVSLGDVNVTLGGNIRARKAPRGQTSLVGTVNTVRGTYDFQGRRFDIQRDGRIQFLGGNVLDPRLDITALRVISGVEVLVHVRGSARAPQLQLSSRPPQDEADILSLIVFNQPVNALGEGQQVSLAQRAGALATGFVASSLANSIGGALELDVFEIQTTAEAGGGGSLTLGEQVGERLFFKFRQAFGAQSVSEFILEYQLADFLRLQTSIAEGGAATQRTLMRRVEQGGVDLIFFFSY